MGGNRGTPQNRSSRRRTIGTIVHRRRRITPTVGVRVVQAAFAMCACGRARDGGAGRAAFGFSKAGDVWVVEGGVRVVCGGGRGMGSRLFRAPELTSLKKNHYRLLFVLNTLSKTAEDPTRHKLPPPKTQGPTGARPHLQK
jgi:hypothetical protein